MSEIFARLWRPIFYPRSWIKAKHCWVQFVLTCKYHKSFPTKIRYFLLSPTLKILHFSWRQAITSVHPSVPRFILRVLRKVSMVHCSKKPAWYFLKTIRIVTHLNLSRIREIAKGRKIKIWRYILEIWQNEKIDRQRWASSHKLATCGTFITAFLMLLGWKYNKHHSHDFEVASNNYEKSSYAKKNLNKRGRNLRLNTLCILWLPWVTNRIHFEFRCD